MNDLISRQAAIDALHMHLMYRMGTDSNKKRLDDWINGLPSAQETHEERAETHACDLISRQAAQPDTHDTNVGNATHKNVIYSPVQMAMDYAVNATDFSASSDTISRQAAIEALWKALYEYEDKTEKQFQESEDLDVGDWIEHRIFVQNMNDIDRQTILNLPPAQPDTEKICARIKAEAIKRNVEYMKHGDRYMLGFVDGMRLARRIVDGTVDDPVYFTTSGE